MFRRLFAGAALALAFAGAALAADLPYTKDIVPATGLTPFNWSGPYVGAHAGWIYSDAKTTDNAADGVNPGPFTFNGNGFLGGVHAGYNIQPWDVPIVLGVEADAEYVYSNTEGTIGSTHAANHQDLKLDNGFRGDLTARIGYSIDLENGSAVLIYGKGGVAGFTGKASQATTFPGYETQKTDNFYGYTIGGGVEYAFDAHWSVKAEVMYTKYGKQDGAQISHIDPPVGHVYKNSTDLSNTTAILGVSYRF